MAQNNDSDNSAGAVPPDSRFRYKLAGTVLIVSIMGLFLLSGVVLWGSWPSADPKTADSYKQFQDSARYVFGAILPLIGAWVGTLMAYYFSRENFEAATRSVKDMADKIISGDERLKQIPAHDKMRLARDITSWSMKPGEEDKAKIGDIMVKFARLERIPMMDDKGVIVYLVYKNVLNQFLTRVALGHLTLANGHGAPDVTFKDVLDSDPIDPKDPKPKDVFQNSFGFVVEDATLADAKSKMESVGKSYPCNDVFVTKTGKRDEPVLGWVTDNCISENLKV
jgi:hypothetical protein